MKKYRFLCLLLFISTLSSAQKSVLIRYQPKVGSTLKSEMRALMDITIFTGGQEIKTEVYMGFDMLYQTKSRKSDVNQIEIVFDKITMDLDNPMMSGSYNSENIDNNDSFALKIAESFKGVIKTGIPVRVDTKGSIIEPIDIVKYFPQIPESKAKELKDQMANQFIKLPENKVEVGATWTMNTSMNQVGEIEYTYTLKSIEKGELLLSVEGKMLDNDAMKMEMLNAVIGGDIKLDRKTGETLESNIVMEMDMKMENQGNVMDMKMKSEISMKAIQM